MEVMKAMAENGLEASVSDAGVGALCARTAVMGAFLNVKINAEGVDDKEFVNDLLSRGAEIEKLALAREKEILDIVNNKINS
jgi:glutamate formiminotransferase/formiminotetrahydrofolate cyclodeaminase